MIGKRQAGVTESVEHRQHVVTQTQLQPAQAAQRQRLIAPYGRQQFCGVARVRAFGVFRQL
ncbi:hypothetical protein QTH91_21685 [Variovorax dokdonensis]|uniref:Uncharacterized protein n=1 Tax=Variovorax dokdonensis TaxID=344883 RepID=A0ABT7NGQ4_9BURK|nr:hypothetical protein [Variovorax dokdonensis]MDM0047119.1 hypothetical protein [Variovorax dokdonensis]